MVMALFSVPVLVSGDENVAEYFFPKVNILEGDLFIIILNPIVENINVSVRTTGGGYSSLVMTNGSLGTAFFPSRVSLVELIPESPVTNITVVLNSNSSVNMRYGILTNNYSYYSQISSNTYSFSSGVLFILQPQTVMPPGASKIVFVLNMLSKQKTGNRFLLEIPPLATLLPIIAIIVLIVYLNTYLMVDSYYISAREELSRSRKFSLVIILVLSILVVYWLMGFILKP